MMFMISMNVIVSMGSILVCSTAIRSAYDHALRMLGYPRKRAMILTYKGSLKTMTPITLMFPSPFGVCMDHRCSRIGKVEDIEGVIIVMINSRAGVGE